MNGLNLEITMVNTCLLLSMYKDISVDIPFVAMVNETQLRNNIHTLY